ncbi:MAG: hypothetical protein WC975_15055 [Phycisphaerae bacterium]
MDKHIYKCAHQLGIILDQGSTALDICRYKISRMIEYHQERFVRSGKGLLSDEELLCNLQRGEFGTGRREGYDLVADVVLAALLEAGVNGAPEVFDCRFKSQVQKWAAIYRCRNPEIVESFTTDLLLPRKKSGSRISTYNGFAPMDGWLKQVLFSQIIKDPQPRILESPELLMSCDIDPMEEYARKDCKEKLAPAFAHMFDTLDDVHRTVLKMAIIDNVEQKKIAVLFGVRDYKIVRMKQKAIEQVTKAFFNYAANEAKLSEISTQECLRLIMKHYRIESIPVLVNLDPSLPKQG